MEKHFIHRTTAVANGPRDWNEALDIIEYGSPEQVFILAVYSFGVFYFSDVRCKISFARPSLQPLLFGFGFRVILTFPLLFGSFLSLYCYLTVIR